MSTFSLLLMQENMHKYPDECYDTRWCFSWCSCYGWHASRDRCPSGWLDPGGSSLNTLFTPIFRHEKLYCGLIFTIGFLAWYWLVLTTNSTGLWVAESINWREHQSSVITSSKSTPFGGMHNFLEFFHFSLFLAMKQVCKLLVAHGADPHVAMKDGSNSLDWAMFFGSLSTADWLVDTCSLDIHHTNSTGCTPLHWAAAGGHLEACKWLLSRGANFSVWYVRPQYVKPDHHVHISRCTWEGWDSLYTTRSLSDAPSGLMSSRLISWFVAFVQCNQWFLELTLACIQGSRLS